MSDGDEVVVTVVPSTFEIVDFDADRIAEAVRLVAGHVGLAAGGSVRVEVDEHSMLSQIRLTSVEPVVISAHSGAFEDRSRPRRISPDNLVDELARLLQRVADRRSPAFGTAPDEDDLSPQQQAAWDAYCLGRTSRWQTHSFRERHRYDFALTCGFDPDAATAFDALWTSTELDWDGVAALTPPAPAHPTKPATVSRRR